MKKQAMILLCALMLLLAAALSFLCVHPSLLPEKATAYYELKAYHDAMNATGPEAELMRLLLGNTPAPEIQPFTPHFSLYGGVLALGAVCALGMLLYKKEKALLPALIWTGTLSLPLMLLGARLFYSLSSLSFYLSDIGVPEAMLKIWEGGLSLSGALLFGALAGVLGAKIGKAPAGRVLDQVAPALMLFAFFAALANLTLPAGFGPETEAALPVLTVLAGSSYRMNTALLCLLPPAALCLLLPRLSFLKKARPGVSFALTAFCYSGSMIFLESLRRDGHMLWGFVHAEMVFSLLFALAGLLFLAQGAKRIPLAGIATIVLAGLVVLIEFALDRSNLSDIGLYAIYFLFISAYLWLGCSCAKRSAGI